MLQQNKKFMLLVAGYGSGKSHTLHMCVATDVAQYPGIKLLVLAPSYDLLRLNNVPGLQNMFDEWGLTYEFNKSEYIFHMSNGAQVILRSMDNPDRIVAFEVCRTYIDEADIPSLVQMENAWNKSLARTRQVLYFRNKIVSNRMWAFSTPEGFKFCYKRWVKLGGPQYGIVRARTVDNPFLPSDFVQSLRDTYPSQLIEAYLNGEFVNLTSGAVYYAFDRSANSSKEDVNGNERLHIGMDFNVNKQMAVVYVQRGEAYHAVREFTDMRDTPDTIKAIKHAYPDNHICVYPDSTGKRSTSVKAGVSDISLLKDAGFTVKAKPSNPFVKDRVAAVNSAFEHNKLFVNTDLCPHFTEALEQQIYDLNGQPDKAAGLDHIVDAGGYPIAFIMPLTNRKAYLQAVSM